MNYRDALKELDEMNEEYLVEMAVINPDFCKQLTLQGEVEQRDEGPIPHMHIYHDKTRNPKKCSYIRLDKAEYSDHHELIRLSKKLKKQFIELMTNPYDNHYMKNNKDEFVLLNGYQYAVQIWVDTFEGGSYKKFNLDENGIPIMPDYSKLKTGR